MAKNAYKRAKISLAGAVLAGALGIGFIATRYSDDLYSNTFYSDSVKQSYQGLVKASKDKRVQNASYRFRNLLDGGYNPDARFEVFDGISRSLGPQNAWYAFVMAQRPSNLPMPTKSEYNDYVREYSKEAGINAMGVDSEALNFMLLSRALEPVLWDITDPRSLGAIAVKNLGKSLGKSDFRRHVERWDRVQHHSGVIAAYENALGRPLQTWQELDEAQWKGLAGAAIERPPDARPRDSITTRTYDPSTGSTTESQRIFIGRSPAEISDIERRESEQQKQQQKEQDWQRFQQDTNRFGQAVQQKGQEVGGQIKGALENLLKDPKKKQN